MPATGSHTQSGPDASPVAGIACFHQATGNVLFRKARNFVIPAKAGIHLDFALVEASRIKVDPGFRRDDEQGRDRGTPWACWKLLPGW